jgi:hypothetical protein
MKVYLDLVVPIKWKLIQYFSQKIRYALCPIHPMVLENNINPLARYMPSIIYIAYHIKCSIYER